MMRSGLQWFVEWAPLVAWLTFFTYIIRELVWPHLPWAKRRLQAVEVSGVDRLGRRILRVPWHRLKWDDQRNSYVIPGYGLATIARTEYASAKRNNEGFDMHDMRAAQDPTPHYFPYLTYPL